MKQGPEAVKQEPEAVKQEEGVYHIQKIVNKRIVNKVLEYRVRCKGYRAAEDTWEKASKLEGYNCVKHYEDSMKEKGLKEGKHGSGSTTTTSTMQLLASLTTGNNSGDENEVVMEDPAAAPKPTSMITEEDFEDSTDGDVVVMMDGGKVCKARRHVEDHGGDAGSETLEEPYPGKFYKVQWGPAVKKILGVTRLDSLLVALVQYDDASYEIVPTSVLADRCPKLLFAYYESRLLIPA